MSYWLSIATSEAWYPDSNQSVVAATLYLNSNNGSSWWGTTISGSLYIGGNGIGFSRTSGGSSSGSWSAAIASHSVTFTHDANGYRGAVGTAGYFGPGSNVPSLSVGGTTYGAIDYDRKPAAPTSVTSVLNADKSITVTSNAVSSPAGTATYYVGYSDDGGSTWSAYTTIPSNGREYVYTLGSLPMGKNYRFRMYASNSDGSSAVFAQTTDTFLPAGGRIYTATGWTPAMTAKRFDGTDWVTLTTAKRYDGTNWVQLG